MHKSTRTPFGTITRAIRILHGEQIHDMASRLGCKSPAELSWYEHGHEPWPQDIVDRIQRMYALSSEVIIRLNYIKENGFRNAFMSPDAENAPSTLKSIQPREENKPYGVTWIINAPWANHYWSQYAVLLFDLQTPMAGQPEPLIKYEGATHEVMVWAVDPRNEFTQQSEIVPPAVFQNRFFRPMCHGYQFTAESDKAAFGYIEYIVRMIETRCLSPDTGHRKTWDRLFMAGMSMRKPVNPDDVKVFFKALGVPEGDFPSAQVIDFSAERDKRHD